jgi:flagellar protein FlaF
MSNASQANVYGQNHKAQVVPTGNSRDTDARALASCARRLDDARVMMQDDPKSKENMKVYCDAIRHNQRLWTIFQVALCDPQNPLPHELKIILLNISRYVDRTSFAAIGKFTPTLIDSLIDINRIIAAGLTKQVSESSYIAPEIDLSNAPPSMLMTSA